MRARGGKVTDGPAYQEGVRARPVDHHPGKMTRKDMNRPKVVTYKKGGRVEAPHHVGKGATEHPQKGGMAPNFNVGSGGGLARMKKAKRAAGFERKVP
jgi:hypothetical protein